MYQTSWKSFLFELKSDNFYVLVINKDEQLLEIANNGTDEQCVWVFFLMMCSELKDDKAMKFRLKIK